MYDYAWTYYQGLERGGFSKIAVLYLADSIAFNQNTIWPNIGWQGQPAGKGDGSLCRDGRHIVNQFWADTQMNTVFLNANPRLQAYQDWQDAISTSSNPSGIGRVVLGVSGVSASGTTSGVAGGLAHGRRRRFIAYKG
jgi:hypothetical protein